MVVPSSTKARCFFVSFTVLMAYTKLFCMFLNVSSVTSSAQTCQVLARLSTAAYLITQLLWRFCAESQMSVIQESPIGTCPYRPTWQSGSWCYCLTWNPHVRRSSWQWYLCLSSSCCFILVRRMDQYRGQQIVGSEAIQPSWCGSTVSGPLGRGKSCLHAFRLGTLTWHIQSHLL
jgi:hypothetical protein